MISSQLTAVLAGRYDPGGVRVVGGAVDGHRGRAGGGHDPAQRRRLGSGSGVGPGRAILKPSSRSGDGRRRVSTVWLSRSPGSTLALSPADGGCLSRSCWRSCCCSGFPSPTPPHRDRPSVPSIRPDFPQPTPAVWQSEWKHRICASRPSPVPRSRSPSSAASKTSSWCSIGGTGEAGAPASSVS